MKIDTLDGRKFLAVNREYVFRMDGKRAIFYPLDYYNTPVTYLLPIESLALSLLDGRKSAQAISELFGALVPNSKRSLWSILDSLNEKAKTTALPGGVGSGGLIEVAESPIEHAPKFDSREFITGLSDYIDVMSDPKTRYRLQTPINVYIVPTHRCHTDCVYCYADKRKTKEMPIERWRELIAEMAYLGIRLCSPDNGDTFARKDGIDIIECMLEHKMHFLLSTKTHVPKAVVGRLLEAGLMEKVNGVIPRKVQLSIDAIDEDLGMRLLNVKRSRHELNVNTFKNFLSFGVMPTVKGVITGLNYHQPLKIVEYFHKLGGRVFNFVRYTRSFHRHSDRLFLKVDHLLRLREEFALIRDRFPDIELSENLSDSPLTPPVMTSERKNEMWAQRSGCGGGWHALGIGPDGRAFLCEQMAYEDPFLVGDASYQSIEKIWNNQKLIDFIHPSRKEFSSEICENCRDFESCIWGKGWCYRDAYYSYGKIHAPPPACPKNEHPGIRMV